MTPGRRPLPRAAVPAWAAHLLPWKQPRPVSGSAPRLQALLFPAGIAFSRDGRYLAVAERRDCKDYVSIFVCSNWQLLRVSRTPAGDCPAPSGQGAGLSFGVVWET